MRDIKKERIISELSFLSFFSFSIPRFLYFLANKFVSHSCVHKFFTLIFPSSEWNYAKLKKKLFPSQKLLSVAVLNQHSTQTTCLIIALIWLGIFIILQSLLLQKLYISVVVLCCWKIFFGNVFDQNDSWRFSILNLSFVPFVWESLWCFTLPCGGCQIIIKNQAERGSRDEKTQNKKQSREHSTNCFDSKIIFYINFLFFLPTWSSSFSLLCYGFFSYFAGWRALVSFPF